MNGIELKSGVNNCHWNVDGKYTNVDVTGNKIPESSSRDWDSKQKCTLTIIGQYVCSCYKPEKKVQQTINFEGIEDGTQPTN